MNKAQGATRLSIFALISAIETDIREAIFIYTTSAELISFLPFDVKTNAERRFFEDLKYQPEYDQELLDYTDFADLAKIINRLTPDLLPSDPEYLKELANYLIKLTPARNRVCHSRPLEPEDFTDILDFAKDYIKTNIFIDWINTKEALTLLQQDQTFVLHLKIPDFWLVDTKQIQNNLPLPEFDETGFLGRQHDRRELKRRLLSDHPIISVIGEGGIGKTALALRCLYDIVDDKENNKYDVVVWVSLKTKAITGSSIIEIEDALLNTLGLVQTIAGELGILEINNNIDNLIDELIEYLREFKVLLAIDNLETIAVSSIRRLLSSVPRGSKIVITSRVGLGELEDRCTLEPMDPKTAVSLARQYAKSLNYKSLYQADKDDLEKYCDRLFYNPLLIKWFVYSSASGADLSILLNRSAKPFKEVVRFCFENLFEKLEPNEKKILHVIASVRYPVSLVELNYLLKDSNQDEIQLALRTLNHSSMLQQTISAEDPSVNLYSLTDIAAEYIIKFSPPDPLIYKTVQDSLKKLKIIAQEGAVQQAAYKYDVFSIHASTKEERICAVYLSKALSAKRLGNNESARTLIEEAKNLLPTYSEIYRVSGIIEAEDPFKASTEYTTAIEYNPTSLIAHYTFAMFLIKQVEHEEALEQINIALQGDPGEPSLETAKALCLSRLGRYSEAASIYSRLLLELSKRPRRWRLSTNDQAMECYRRWAEQDKLMKDQGALIEHIDMAISIFQSAHLKGDTDVKMFNRLLRVADEALTYPPYVQKAASVKSLFEIIRHVQLTSSWVMNSIYFQDFIEKYSKRFSEQAEISQVLQEIEQSIETSLRNANEMLPSLISAYETNIDRREGIISNIINEDRYGFITERNGSDLFFHENYLMSGNFDSLKKGMKVYFRYGENYKGPCAVEVEVPLSQKVPSI